MSHDPTIPAPIAGVAPGDRAGPPRPRSAGSRERSTSEGDRSATAPQDSVSPRDRISRNEAPPRYRARFTRAADTWLCALFLAATHAPWLLALLRPVVPWLVMRFSPAVRQATISNARCLLPPGSSERARRAFGQRVVGSFYDFIIDVGRSAGASADMLCTRIDSVSGEHLYTSARAQRKGAIIVTAHMGSFEVGLAALRRYERAGAIHVVFRHDLFDRFERLRSDLRRRLGIVEQNVDDAPGVWLRLREALLRDEVVVLQGDRVMPGQKGQVMPMLGGFMSLPTGPVRLALATGAPIIPVFTRRLDSGRIGITIDEPVFAADLAGAQERLARSIERAIRDCPGQWLVLEPAFCEDPAAGARAKTNDEEGCSAA